MPLPFHTMCLNKCLSTPCAFTRAFTRPPCSAKWQGKGKKRKSRKARAFLCVWLRVLQQTAAWRAALSAGPAMAVA